MLNNKKRKTGFVPTYTPKPEEKEKEKDDPYNRLLNMVRNEKPKEESAKEDSDSGILGKLSNKIGGGAQRGRGGRGIVQMSHSKSHISTKFPIEIRKCCNSCEIVHPLGFFLLCLNNKP